MSQASSVAQSTSSGGSITNAPGTSNTLLIVGAVLAAMVLLWFVLRKRK
jgi:LPXTG-motif cell wall-anchored protein